VPSEQPGTPKQENRPDRGDWMRSSQGPELSPARKHPPGCLKSGIGVAERIRTPSRSPFSEEPLPIISMSHTQTSREAGAPSPLAGTNDTPGEEPYEALPWTGITLVLAVVGLLLFMAVPMGRPRLQEMMAMQGDHSVRMAREELSRAIEEYHNDHGVWPGARPEEVGTLNDPVHRSIWLARQLEMCTDGQGFVVPQFLSTHPWGPYLPSGIPLNPDTGLNTVRMVGAEESIESANDSLYGWIYDPTTGLIVADQRSIATVQE
jgi:hypothetical protein